MAHLACGRCVLLYTLPEAGKRCFQSMPALRANKAGPWIKRKWLRQHDWTALLPLADTVQGVVVAGLGTGDACPHLRACLPWRGDSIFREGILASSMAAGGLLLLAYNLRLQGLL